MDEIIERLSAQNETNGIWAAPMDTSHAQESENLFGGLSIGSGASEILNSNNNAHLHLVHQSSTTQIYRKGHHEGIKVILDSNPTTQEKIRSRLEHERHITNDILPQSFSKRRITKIEPFNGYQSFHFEWVEGISLKDRIIEKAKPPQPEAAVDWRARLRMATAVAKTLSEYHEAGIAHNLLSTSNIILDATADGHFVAVFIDLSRATTVTSSKNSPQNDEAKRIDLKDLGQVFRELFSEGEQYSSNTIKMGEHNHNSSFERNEEIDVQFMRRSKRERQTDATDGLPMYLSSFISALTNACSGGNEFGEVYDDIKDVLADLKAATNKCDIYCLAPSKAILQSHNQLLMQGDGFYGRKSELSMLMHSLNSVIQGISLITTVSGLAGMGKTTLVNQIEEPLKERNGYLIRAKFDQNTRQPDSVIFSAIDSFLGKLVQEGDMHILSCLKQRIDDIVGPCVSILTKSIPNLGKFVDCIIVSDDDDEVPPNTQQQRSQQSKLVLTCSLICAIANQKKPVVLLIDDLQWADQTSLDLVQQILTDQDIRYCFCIICYRDDDKLTPPVTNMLNGVKGQGTSVQTIHLGPIERESVNTLISEALCLPPSLSRNISGLVHSKTGGAALFVVNFLQTLNKEGLIRLNLSTRRWEYDLSKIRMTEIPADVVQYLTMQMTKLHQNNTQVALKVASCFGSQFDLLTFKKAKVTGVALEEFLPTLASSGFLHEVSPEKFMWAHDQVRQAAYELIPPSKRKMFHLLIGTKILMNTPEEQLEDSIFDIVPHMTVGQEYLQIESQKYEVAELNLIAGRRAIKTFSFHSAAVYFLSGINLLPEDCWERRYKLSLNLHDAAIEASYAVGNFAQLCTLVSTVLSKAKTLEDKLNAHNKQVRYLTSTGQSEGGISQCLVVLEELGEKLPEQLTNEIAVGYMHVKNLLATHSEDSILRLPVMVAESKLAAMEFLSLSMSSCSNTRPQLGVLVMLRMVKMSLEWGICDVSAFSFALYGGFLVSPFIQDVEGGYRYGNIALKLLDRFLSKGQHRFKAQVYLLVYAMINIFREPWQASLDKLLDGYRDGCRCGDLEYAFLCLQRHSVFQLHSGRNLIKLEQELTSSARKTMQYGQISARLLIVIWLSTVLEMTGDTSREDPYITFFSCTEDALIQQHESQNNFSFCHIICIKRKFVCMFKGDLDGAVHLYHTSLKLPHGELVQSTSTILGTFLDGLIAFACAQKHQSDEEYWTNIALEVIEKFQKWVKSSAWNFSHKLYLLEAEHNVLKGNDEAAVSMYDLSITTARKHRFVQEEGLSFERAGYYHFHNGRHDRALSCFSSAKECYERWGAFSVTDRMAAKCKELVVGMLE